MLRPTRCLLPYRCYFARLSGGTLGAELVDDVCKEFLLRRLLHCQNAYHVSVHAYLLLETEVLLLMTPGTPKGFDALSACLRASYSDYFSIRFCRNDRLSFVEPKAGKLDSLELVRECQKYIERYVVLYRGRSHPGEYRFSSYCSNAFSLRPRHIHRHGAFDCMFADRSRALENYRAFIAEEFGRAQERILDRSLGIDPRLPDREADFDSRNIGL